MEHSISKSKQSFGIDMQLFSDASGTVLKLLAMLALVTLPIHPALIAAGTLVALDFVTGIWAALKKKNKLTSAKLRRTVVKVCLYQIGIVTAFVIETWLMPDAPMVKVMTAYIGMVEGKSIFENLHRITGVNLWTEIVSKLNLADVKQDDKPESK